MKCSGVSGYCCVWLLLSGGALGCAGARVTQQPAKVAAAPAAKSPLAPEAPLPPLTPPPTATPEIVVRFDLQRLTRGITQGSKVSLNADSIIAVGSFLGADASKPFTFASALDFRRTVTAWHTASPASLTLGPVNPSLAEQGWTPLASGSCSLATSPNSGSTVACGSAESLVAFGNSIRSNTGTLRGDHALEVALDLEGTWDRLGIHGLRDAVPRQVDSLLDSPELKQSVPLHLAASDLGFDLSGRLLEASQDLGRVRLALTLDEQGTGRYRADLEPAGETPLGKALAAARTLTAPKALWQLPYDTKSAVFVDSSLLVPFLTPGRRALALLGAAADKSAAGAVAAALSTAFSACVAPNRALVQANASVSTPKISAKKAVADKDTTAHKPAQKPAAAPKPAEHLSPYQVFELEDPGGACAAGLGTLLKAYVAAEAPAQKPAESPIAILKPGTDVPKATWVARVGSAADAEYVALSTSPGTTQILWADSLPALNAASVALRSALARHRTLAERTDLATLSKEAVLLGGFVPEDSVSLGMGPGAAHGHDDARVPFSVSRDGADLAIVGAIQAQTMRRFGGQFLEKIWENQDWTKLNGDQKNALVHVLDGTCHLGDGASCNGLGVRYGDGAGLPKDVDRAHELLTLGCEQDHGMACVNLGFYGASPTEQLTTFKKACELESAFGCAWYGTRLLQSKKTEDHTDAIPHLEFACDGSSGFGCSELGLAYLKGIGVTEDDEKAADYEARSCHLGFGSGCVGIGNAYATGVGRKKNAEQSLDAYKAACQLDKAFGCYALGVAYLKGVGAPKDLDAARSQLTVACDAGHADACRVLAEMTDAP
jgi:TPR repeat protein